MGRTDTKSIKAIKPNSGTINIPTIIRIFELTSNSKNNTLRSPIAYTQNLKDFSHLTKLQTGYQFIPKVRL